MTGIVIAGFPGIGKTTLFNNVGTALKVTDSDSSQFSWIVVDGEKVRNPEFPKNYIKHIRECLSTHDLVLVSTHKDVRNILDGAEICYALVYPSIDAKEDYLARYTKRGSPESFIKLMDEKFESFVEECATHDSLFVAHYELDVGEYLADILPQIRENMPEFVEEIPFRRELRDNTMDTLRAMLENQERFSK